MAADLDTARAQARKAPATEVAALFENAIALWNDAANACDGRRREHARANRRDLLAALESVDEVLEAGPACARSQQDARSMQDLGAQALGDRRWADATRLYRRAVQLWEMAAEQCAGRARAQAAEQLARVQVDAHNAQHCAPVFDLARSQTQRWRRTAATLPAEARELESQRTETLWREAAQRCQGPALDLAQAQAAQTGSERGTPWVATPLPPELQTAVVAPVLPETEPAAVRPTSAQDTGSWAQAPGEARAAAQGATSVGAASDPGGATPASAVQSVTDAARSAQVALSKLVAPAVSLAEPSASAAAAAAAADEVDVVLALGARLTGRLTRDPGSGSYTGRGKLAWTHGDVYEGELVSNRRHGRGEFRWANGQRYAGDWVDDTPQGHGQIWFVDGAHYEGRVQGGKPHGQGTMRYANGDRHRGEFAAGQPDGPGQFTWASGQTLEAVWSSGSPSGEARLGFPDGRRYQGEVRDGVPHGRGSTHFATGDVYEGDFVGGLQHGQGEYRWHNGDRYTGQWQTGRRHGQGLFVWHNGDAWKGRFADNAQTADGEFVQRAGVATGGTPGAAPAPPATPATAPTAGTAAASAASGPAR